MNQEKIGKFIAKNRKKKKITQSYLAEKLGVTDRAVSNWETEKNMPDLTLFKPLCDILDITINELLSGENLTEKEYNEKLEENFINTINYIDKKNIKSNDIKSISYLLIGLIGLCMLSISSNSNDIQNYLEVVSMILVVYGTKRLFVKYKLARKIVLIILIIISVIIYLLNK